MMLFFKIGVVLFAVHLFYLSLPKHTPLKWRGRFLRWGLLAAFIAVIFTSIARQGKLGPSALHILPEISLNTPSEPPQTENGKFNLSWKQGLTCIYFTGLSFSLFAMAWGLWGYLKIHRTSTRRGNTNLYEISGRVAPFSFFNKIYLPPHLSFDEEKTILLHEQAHISKNHAVELLAFRLLALLYWFWPPTHALVRQLRLLHEYEADQHVLQNTSPELYKKTLLRHSVLQQLTVVHSFTHSLKSRFAMMTIKPKNNKAGLAFRTLALATLTVFLSLSGMKAVAQTEPKEKTGIVDLDKFPKFAHCEDSENREESFNCFMSTILKHISSNIVYNPTLKENKLEDRVFVNITFGDDGEVKDVKIIRGFKNGKEKFQEAIDQQHEHIIEVFLQMPDFEPGEKDGKKVSVEYTVPINFTFQEGAEK